MDRISPNSVYVFILTRSGLGLLPVIFRKFETELCFCSISCEQIDVIYIYTFILTRSMLGLLRVIFLIICIRVMALYLCQNFFSALYL